MKDTIRITITGKPRVRAPNAAARVGTAWKWSLNYSGKSSSGEGEFNTAREAAFAATSHYEAEHKRNNLLRQRDNRSKTRARELEAAE